MDFEFDPKKSLANKAKHGIDFIEAQALWTNGTGFRFPARTTDEPRFMVIGLIEGKFWTAIATPRESKTRIISVRASRREERERYEKAKSKK